MDESDFAGVCLACKRESNNAFIPCGWAVYAFLVQIRDPVLR